MLTPKDLEKYHQAAERILNAMDNSPVPISWHEMDRMALQSVIAKELILIDKEARSNPTSRRNNGLRFASVGAEQMSPDVLHPPR